MRNKGVFDLCIQWVPGHKDFAPNTKADVHAKGAARGESSQGNMLLKILKKALPVSISTTQQDLKSKIWNKWLYRWKVSPRYIKTRAINKSSPSNKWLKLVTLLPCAQASIIMQLCTGHISLNKHLFCINHANSPNCSTHTRDCSALPPQMWALPT